MNTLRSRKDIEIDFVKACNQSRELMNISNNLFKIAGSDMMETMAMVRLSWQGGNVESFYGKTEKLRTDLMNIAEDLARIANHINHTADIIYRKEMITIGVCS